MTNCIYRKIKINGGVPLGFFIHIALYLFGAPSKKDCPQGQTLSKIEKIK